MAAKKQGIITSGKRKTAIARASVLPGTGVVRIDGKMLTVYEPRMTRMRIMEPITLAGDIANNINIDVSVSGGGVSSQADAIRLAIGRALVQHAGAKSPLRQTFLDYDRSLLVADIRVKEVCKPNDSKARAKRQKSYR